MTSVRGSIFSGIATKLQQIPWVKVVAWDRIRLTSSDIADHEIPLIQFYATRASNIHLKSRIETSLQVYIEIVLKQTVNLEADQALLFEYMEDIEKKLGEDPSVGVSNMLHLKYIADEVDLHMIEPYYYGRLEFEAIYHKKYSTICD